MPPTKGISVTQPKHSMRSLTIRDDARAISDLLLGLDNASAGSREPQSAARLSAFRSFMTPPSPTETHAPLSVPRLRTMVIVGVDDYVKILAGEGDEVQLALSDGTTMTGAEYLTHLVAGRSGCSSERDGSSGDDSTGANDVTFALFHPTEGGVNTYRARFANSKQRDLAVAEHPVCAWPGCSVPGYLCEIHHLTAHKHGGETNPSNLAPSAAITTASTTIPPALTITEATPSTWSAPRTGLTTRSHRLPGTHREALDPADGWSAFTAASCAEEWTERCGLIPTPRPALVRNTLSAVPTILVGASPDRRNQHCRRFLITPSVVGLSCALPIRYSEPLN